MIILWICLLAVPPGLPVNAVVVFEKSPETTCGVKGGEAHLVWDYDDTVSTVTAIRWFNGTDSGTPMGAYATGTDTLAIFSGYEEKLTFHKTSALFKSAVLTIKELQDTDEGNYTTRFEAATDTDDVSILEVAQVPDFLGWEICVDGTCRAISDPLTLSASADVKVKFTKGGALTCAMDISVTLSGGVSFVLAVPEGLGATAEHALVPATHLDAGFLSIDSTFGKNGEVFYTGTTTNVSVISGGQSPTPAQAAAIAFGVIFIIVGIILVAVVLFKGNKKAGLKLADKVCVGVGVGLCVIGCILVVVFVAALAYLTSAEIAGACVAVCVVTVVILIVIVVVWYKMKAPSVEGSANGTPMQKSPDDRVTKPTHAHDVGNGGDVAARPLPSRPAGRLSPLHNSVTPENQEDDQTRSQRKHKKKKSKKGHREDEDYRGTEEA